MALATPAAVVLELMTMGQQSAAHLGDLLRATSPQGGHHHELAAEILRCCGRVIAALTATAGKKRKAPEYEDEPAADASPPATAMPPKKRARGGEALRVVRTNTVVDGFIWRKYGQKDINGREHPRLYYRCAHRHEGCNATRRVQRTQGGPAAAYEIAYYGEHTCCRGAAACQAAVAPPTVVDVGSNAAAAARGWGSSGSPAASEQRWSWDGEASSQGWSSSSASSEVWSEAQQAHEWHDTGSAARAEEPSAAATPCHDSPVLQFLDGCFDWESVLVNDPFDFGGLHHVAALQY